MSAELQVEFAGEWLRVPPDEVRTVGRAGDLAIDDNQYLHRVFLEFRCVDGLWTVRNVGNRLGATIADSDGAFSAQLRSGAALPLVLPRLRLTFAAGPTSYELLLVVPEAPYEALGATVRAPDGTRTRGRVSLTPDQLLCILVLAEPALRRGGSGASRLPTSKDAAKRLDWTTTKFNRKLDNVCQKLAKHGIRGLHGEPGDLASNRRARLVEHALATGLVSPEDLELLP